MGTQYAMRMMRDLIRQAERLDRRAGPTSEKYDVLWTTVREAVRHDDDLDDLTDVTDVSSVCVCGGSQVPVYRPVRIALSALYRSALGLFPCFSQFKGFFSASCARRREQGQPSVHS